MVKVWDLRMVTEKYSIEAAASVGVGANKATFSHSGNLITVPLDDSKIKTYELSQSSSNTKEMATLNAYAEAIQIVLYDNSGQTLISGGVDGFVRLWN